MSAHTAKRKIAEFSSRGEDFLRKYNELKLRQTRDLDPLVYLLSKMTEDQQLCSFLKASRLPVKEAKRREIRDVKVLDLVEGQELELPDKGWLDDWWDLIKIAKMEKVFVSIISLV